MEAKYLIVKQGFYYRPNERGYTSSAIQAGRYTQEQAEQITHPNGADGPRDGMHFVHEDDICDQDWQAFSTLARQVIAAQKLAEAVSAMIDNLIYGDFVSTTRIDNLSAALAEWEAAQ